MIRSPLVITAAIVCTTAGCDSGIGQDAGVHEEHRRAETPTAEVRIGQMDGRVEYLFDQIHGVALIGNNLIVTDRSGTIRRFDSAGGWIGTTGRRGKGPGEYHTPFIVGVHGDGGLQIYDSELRRLTTMTGTGGVLDSRVVEASGSPVGSGGGTMWLESLGILRSGAWAATYAAIDLDTGKVTSTVHIDLPSAKVTENAGMVLIEPQEPWRRPIALACGPSLCLVLPPADTIWRFTSRGERSFAGRLPKSTKVGPQHRPSLVSDEQGRLWASLLAGGSVMELAPVDSLVGTGYFTVPVDFKPHLVQNGRVAGVETDLLGVEAVAVYPMSKRD